MVVARTTRASSDLDRKVAALSVRNTSVLILMMMTKAFSARVKMSWLSKSSMTLILAPKMDDCIGLFFFQTPLLLSMLVLLLEIIVVVQY